jgi:hypothetical protein
MIAEAGPLDHGDKLQIFLLTKKLPDSNIQQQHQYPR